MSDLTLKLAINLPGPFYVDETCIDCDLCRSSAPSVFGRDDTSGYSYVHRQPKTPEEVATALEAMEGCPTNSIGNDGEMSL